MPGAAHGRFRQQAAAPRPSVARVQVQRALRAAPLLPSCRLSRRNERAWSRQTFHAGGSRGVKQLLASRPHNLGARTYMCPFLCFTRLHFNHSLRSITQYATLKQSSLPLPVRRPARDQGPQVPGPRLTASWSGRLGAHCRHVSTRFPALLTFKASNAS
jgi:hypothetical protein